MHVDAQTRLIILLQIFRFIVGINGITAKYCTCSHVQVEMCLIGFTLTTKCCTD